MKQTTQQPSMALIPNLKKMSSLLLLLLSVLLSLLLLLLLSLLSSRLPLRLLWLLTSAGRREVRFRSIATLQPAQRPA